MTAESLPPAVRRLTQAQARRLTDTANRHLQALVDVLGELYRGRAWEALGHPSWAAYARAELRIRVPADERGETVPALVEAGLSERAISAATGLSRNTVAKILRPPEMTGVAQHEPLDSPDVFGEEERQRRLAEGQVAKAVAHFERGLGILEGFSSVISRDESVRCSLIAELDRVTRDISTLVTLLADPDVISIAVDGEAE